MRPRLCRVAHVLLGGKLNSNCWRTGDSEIAPARAVIRTRVVHAFRMVAATPRWFAWAMKVAWHNGKYRKYRVWRDVFWCDGWGANVRR